MTIGRQAKREAAQLLRFCKRNGSLDENRVRRVVRHVVAAGYRESPAILSHFLRLLRLELEQHTATIESAAPLPDDLRATTRENLTRLYGEGLITTFIDNSSLIGGMRIQVGSNVYDSSVLGKLAAMEKTF